MATSFKTGDKVRVTDHGSYPPRLQKGAVLTVSKVSQAGQDPCLEVVELPNSTWLCSRFEHAPPPSDPQPKVRTWFGEIDNACVQVSEMLCSKQVKYGNSIFEPMRVFSKVETAEAIKVRIDDKLSRIMRGNGDDEDTLLDLIGYLILLRIHQKEQASK